MLADPEVQPRWFFDLVKARRSVRSFQDLPVEPEKVEAVVEAANAAPSAGNLQSYEIYRVTGKKLRFELARAALEQMFLAHAPVLLVFCAHPAPGLERYSEAMQALYPVQDATIACTFAMLAAEALGLATVWIGAMDTEAVRELIGAPPDHRPVAILPLAYPAEHPAARPRRAIASLVHEV